MTFLPQFAVAQNGSYQSASLFIVLIGLGVLAALIKVLGMVMAKGESPTETHSSAGSERPGQDSPVSETNPNDVPPEIFAVVAAALTTLLEEPHNILSVKAVSPQQPYDQNLLAWSVEGRRQIFTSHQIR